MELNREIIRITDQLSAMNAVAIEKKKHELKILHQIQDLEKELEENQADLKPKTEEMRRLLDAMNDKNSKASP